MREQKREKDFPLKNFYAGIYRRYDLINRIFTFGMDKRWRKVTAELCMKEGPERIIDLCCGTGDLAFAIRKRAGGGTQVTGYDYSEEMLQVAREKQGKFSLDRISFIQGDAADMPFSDAEFDSLTIGFGFRNLIYQNSNAARHLAEISRILRNGSHLYILESAIPSNRLIHFFYSLYLSLVLIPLGGIISGDWKAYRYLAKSSAGFYQPAELQEILKQYGMRICSVRKFFFGAASLMIARKE
ncbi:MAG: ubiquinone/menaquinone biosynthesis methyltransferase [Bacteroidales bacterium]|nr:ubiquinone/menaquinone biosynthesis methyltransferase [Bacteroidales bacterium]